MIEDERRREVRRSELARLAQSGRVHQRSIGERLGRLVRGARD